MLTHKYQVETVTISICCSMKVWLANKRKRTHLLGQQTEEQILQNGIWHEPRRPVETRCPWDHIHLAVSRDPRCQTGLGGGVSRVRGLGGSGVFRPRKACAETPTTKKEIKARGVMRPRPHHLTPAASCDQGFLLGHGPGKTCRNHGN